MLKFFHIFNLTNPYKNHKKEDFLVLKMGFPTHRIDSLYKIFNLSFFLNVAIVLQRKDEQPVISAAEFLIDPKSSFCEPVQLPWFKSGASRYGCHGETSLLLEKGTKANDLDPGFKSLH